MAASSSPNPDIIIGAMHKLFHDPDHIDAYAQKNMQAPPSATQTVELLSYRPMCFYIILKLNHMAQEEPQ